MDARVAMQDSAAMVDVQAAADSRKIAIDQVGIKAIRYPLQVRDRSDGVQRTIAVCNLYVSLPHHFKGTHMSRFVEILNGHDREVSVETLPEMLCEMVEKLEAGCGRIEMNFPYFIRKSAPISGVFSLMDYDVTLIGDIDNGHTTSTIRVVVPVTSLCPCSKKISARGAHNQRSHVTITVTINRHLWIEELVGIVESEASCQVYGLLKRPDEKFVTEHAYDNPKFVEDMVRDVAARLQAEPRIDRYTVEAENFESIHNHSAYALIEGSR